MRTVGLLMALGGFLIAACSEKLEPNDIRKPERTFSGPLVLDTGYIMIDGTPTRVVYEVVKGRALFEGDIDLGPVDRIAGTEEELLERSPQRGPTGVVIGPGSRWPGGRVPYVIDPNISTPQRVLDAMAHIAARSGGVHFAPKTSWDNNYVRFYRTTDASICGKSAVGVDGGQQLLLVRDDAAVACIVHELGHALGFWHEQSRCDRDNFVEILWSNIVDGRSDQFEKKCLWVEQLESYDELSIMHYHAHAFGKIVNGSQLQTIHSLRGFDEVMGLQDTLSDIDNFTLVRMYKPYGPIISSVTNQNGYPLIAWQARGRATSYQVAIVREYNEWNDYAGTHTSYVDQGFGLPATSNLSILDEVHPWTGNSYCELWSNINGSANYTYWLEIYATYANGVVSTVARDALAPITPGEPPCLELN